jgi:hypothetical protein
MVETAHLQSHYKVPESAHNYGDSVRLLDDPLAWSPSEHVRERQRAGEEGTTARSRSSR